jgi:hypothetical protein
VDQLNGVATPADNGEVNVAGVLRQAAQAVLRPAWWDVVGDIVEFLSSAVRAGDDERAQELAADLAQVSRPRTTGHTVDTRVPAPQATRAAIEQAIQTVAAGPDAGRTFMTIVQRRDLG